MYKQRKEITNRSSRYWPAMVAKGTITLTDNCCLLGVRRASNITFCISLYALDENGIAVV